VPSAPPATGSEVVTKPLMMPPIACAIGGRTTRPSELPTLRMSPPEESIHLLLVSHSEELGRQFDVIGFG